MKPRNPRPSGSASTGTDRRRFTPAAPRRNSVNGPSGQAGFLANPLAATIFFALVLIVVTYTLLDRTGVMARLGRFGPLLPLLVIVWLAFGIYHLMKRLKKRAARIRVRGPLFMRALMNDCLERTCGALEKRLNTPEISSSAILNDILLDKMHHICAADCQRFSDIRRRIEGSRLKSTDGRMLAGFLQTPVEYDKQPLPEEIRQVADTVSRSRRDLEALLARLKDAHKTLCTGSGNILTLLPPDPKTVEKVRATYRYRPPTPERTQRMVFALETLAYLKAIRHENVNPMDRRRYEAVATRVIPKIADALRVYRQAWQDLADAYERPQDERAA